MPFLGVYAESRGAQRAVLAELRTFVEAVVAQMRPGRSAVAPAMGDIIVALDALGEPRSYGLGAALGGGPFRVVQPDAVDYDNWAGLTEDWHDEDDEDMQTSGRSIRKWPN